MNREKLSTLWDRYGFYAALFAVLFLIGWGVYALKNPPSAPAPIPSAPLEAAQSMDETLEDKKPTLVFPVQSREILMPQGDTIWSETLAQYQTHAGVDILSDAGEAVLAALPGTVADTGIDPLLGFYVHLSHEDGVSTRYACLQARDRPEAGKSVAAGDVIGYVGNPGLSECVLPPHLHFEAYADGVWSDLFPGLS